MCPGFSPASNSCSLWVFVISYICQNKHCNLFFVLKNNNNKDISILPKSRIASIPCWHDVWRQVEQYNTETEEIKRSFFYIKDGVLELGRFKWREYFSIQAKLLHYQHIFLLHFVLQPINNLPCQFQEKREISIGEQGISVICVLGAPDISHLFKCEEEQN